MASYEPAPGDVVWLRFDPQAGHEQSDRRLALVLSPVEYNRATHLMVCCPLITQQKGYPFEVPVEDNTGSAVLADQVRNLDWVARQAEYRGRVAENVLSRVRQKARALVGEP